MTNFIEHFPGRTVSINNTEHLYFGGTSYLGLQNDPQFQEIFIQNVKKYGTGYGASRNSNIRFSLYDPVEKSLAQLVGSESCVTLSSGFLAGQLITNTLNRENYHLFYAPNTHAAVHSHNSNNYSTYNELNESITKFLSVKNDKPPVIVLDSIDFSRINFPSFKALKTLPINQCILLVDDSHGIGVIGNNGGGVFKQLQTLHPKELIVCSSLGKALGTQAGAIFGTKNRIESLKKTPFYGGASPATPATLATLHNADTLITKKRTTLLNNTSQFTTHLNNLSSFTYMEGHPTYSFENEKLTEYLKSHQIQVTSFRYPTENSGLMSRIVLSAAHISSDIERLVEVLNDYK